MTAPQRLSGGPVLQVLKMGLQGSDGIARLHQDYEQARSEITSRISTSGGSPLSRDGAAPRPESTDGGPARMPPTTRTCKEERP